MGEEVSYFYLVQYFEMPEFYLYLIFSHFPKDEVHKSNEGPIHKYSYTKVCIMSVVNM